MKSRILISCASVAFASITLSATASDLPCVAVGDSIVIEDVYPTDLGQMPVAGIPTQAQWRSDNPTTGWNENAPQIIDDDVVDDDLMGRALLTDNGDGTTTARAVIRNEGGEIVGPNGHVDDELLEGGCREVFLRRQYIYPQTIKTTQSTSNEQEFSLDGSGASVASQRSVSRLRTIWVYGYWYSELHEVCPC